MKRFVQMCSVFLVLMIVLSVAAPSFVNTATAQSYTSADGLFTYEILEDGTAELRSYNGDEIDLVLPAQVDGYVVTSLYFKFYYSRNTRSITIPETLVNFGSANHSLVYAYFQEFHVAENHPLFSTEDGVLFNKDKTVLVRYPANKGTSYVVPDGVLEIGTGAFSRCEDMVSVTLPQGLKCIGENAFFYCGALKDINIPSSVSSFGASAFYATKSLAKFVVPDGVRELPSSMFLGSGVKEVYIPDSVTSFSNEVFSYVTATIYGTRGSAADHYVNDGTAINAYAKLTFVATDETTTSATTTKTTKKTTLATTKPTTVPTTQPTEATTIAEDIPATTVINVESDTTGSVSVTTASSTTTVATTTTTTKSTTSTTIKSQTTTTSTTIPAMTDAVQKNGQFAAVWWIVGGVLLVGVAAGLGYPLYKKYQNKR